MATISEIVARGKKRGLREIEETIARFPNVFYLDAFPGETFRFSHTCSFVGQDGKVILCAQRLGKHGKWEDVAKETAKTFASLIR
jgi:hypothetical protein